MNATQKCEKTYLYSQSWQPIKQPPVIKPILPISQFERIVIDLVNLKQYSQWNGGYKYILTVIDSFSQYGFTFALKSKKSNEVAECLRELFNSHCPPKKLQSDNGGEFIASIIKELCDSMEVEIIHGAPYKPSTQGKVERFNQTIERELGKYLTNKEVKRWVDALPIITKSYNMTYHSSIKAIPFEAFYNWKPWQRTYVNDLNKIGKFICNTKLFVRYLRILFDS